MRKRNSFARIGTLSVALLMALGAMGTAYGVWSETLSIIGTAEIGTVSANITWCGGCSHPAIISCDVVASNELEVTVADAAEVGTDYSCDFDIKNSGTIPLKIQDIVVSPLPPAEGVVVWTTDVVVGTQIEPGEIKGGTVHVYLDEEASEFTFTVTIEVVQWNQYVPPP